MLSCRRLASRPAAGVPAAQACCFQGFFSALSKFVSADVLLAAVLFSMCRLLDSGDLSAPGDFLLGWSAGEAQQGLPRYMVGAASQVLGPESLASGIARGLCVGLLSACAASPVGMSMQATGSTTMVLQRALSPALHSVCAQLFAVTGICAGVRQSIVNPDLH